MRTPRRTRRTRLVVCLVFGMLLSGSAAGWTSLGLPRLAIAQALIAVALLFVAFVGLLRLDGEDGP